MKNLLKKAALAVVSLMLCGQLIAAEKHVYIKDVEDEDKGVVSTLEALRTATANDTVCINVNSYGGLVSTMFEIVNAIKRSKAYVVTIADGYAMSAGGVIAVSGDKVKISQNAIFMIHKTRTKGKAGPIISEGALADIINERMLSIYGDLIDPKLLPIIKEGTDLFIKGEYMRAFMLKSEEWKTRILPSTSNICN